MYCLKCIISNMNCICIPLIPYAYIPKRHVRFSYNAIIHNNISHGSKMIR